MGDTPGSLIVVEGIYSMIGDVAPLKEMVAIKKEMGAYLLVDEAHSMGVLGEKGRGLAEAAGVEDDVDFIVGTFSKSLGAVGGFLVSDERTSTCCASSAGALHVHRLAAAVGHRLGAAGAARGESF